MKIGLSDVLLAAAFVVLFSLITDVLTELANIGADVTTIATATGATK